MAQDIKTSLDKLNTALEGDKTSLTEMKVTVPDTAKHSDIPGLIKTIEAGGGTNIYVDMPDAEGFPEGTEFIGTHTDGTEVRGSNPLIVTKGGKWTITDSFSDFSDTVQVQDTFTGSHILPTITVTTDIGDGETQTAKQGDTTLSATVSDGKVKYYLPKLGQWTIGYEGSEATVDVNVTQRTDYNIVYFKSLFKMTVKITNASSHDKYYIKDASEYCRGGWTEHYWGDRWTMNPFSEIFRGFNSFGEVIDETVDNTSSSSTVTKEISMDGSKFAGKDIKWFWVSHEERYTGSMGEYFWTGVLVDMPENGGTATVDYSTAQYTYVYSGE